VQKYSVVVVGFGFEILFVTEWVLLALLSDLGCHTNRYVDKIWIWSLDLCAIKSSLCEACRANGIQHDNLVVRRMVNSNDMHWDISSTVVICEIRPSHHPQRILHPCTFDYSDNLDISPAAPPKVITDHF
jgi:hypothetical protein